MSEITTVKHLIQNKIIDYLKTHEQARFKDVRPKGVDTNLCTYHLGKLVRGGLVEKDSEGYSLSLAGMSYVEYGHSLASGSAVHPKVGLLFLIQNSDGDVLVEKRTTQPFLARWSLPFGDMQTDDDALIASAGREYKRKFTTDQKEIVHAGICYVRTEDATGAQLVQMMHVLRCYSDEIVETETLVWARPHKLHQHRLVPGAASIIARGFFKDPFFFEEYKESWPLTEA